MNVLEITTSIFGKNFSEELKAEQANQTKSEVQHLLNLVQKHIYEVATSSNLVESSNSDYKFGKIGSNIVTFNEISNNGLFTITPNKLGISSQSNFSTVRANVAVFSGKWMYEVQLGSAGVMQIGWSTLQCRFNQESGVGDTLNSYAYDGNRVRKWNISTYKYGDHWVSGDIIGSAIDLEDGTITFFRNGRNLGIAFEKISTGEDIAYFPTVSLAFSENLIANFGNTPLWYPVKNYKELQEPPINKCHIANILFTWLENLLHQLKYMNGEDSSFEYEVLLSPKAFLVCLARCIFKEIGMYLKESYILIQVFISFLERICKIPEVVLICLDLMWVFLEEDELLKCWEITFQHLSACFRQVSLSLHYPQHQNCLNILNTLCQHVQTRQFLLSHILFDKIKFVNFLHVKPIDEECLSKTVTKVWWDTNQGDKSIEDNKEEYLRAINKIKLAISEIETLQVELLIKLLDNNDGSNNNSSSRAIFLKKFRPIILENMYSNRIFPNHQTPLPIALCCVHRLLHAFRILWNIEVGSKPIYIPCKIFCDSSINNRSTDRLGGDYSYLRKTFRDDIVSRFGPDLINDHDNASQQPRRNVITIYSDPITAGNPLTQMFNIETMNLGVTNFLQRIGYFSENREEACLISMGPLDPLDSLAEMLDGIILLYHVAGKKQISKVVSLRDMMSDYVTALLNAQSKLEKLEKNDENSLQVIKQLELTVNVFKKRLSEEALTMAWVQAAVFSEEKQSHLVWLLWTVIVTLQKSSSEENLFSFVPEFYLEMLSELINSLKNQFHPTVPFSNINNLHDILKDIATFLCNHYLDPRIVSANSKETIVLMLAGFTSFPITLEALENAPNESRIRLVSNLLKPYENKAWAQANWVLVRFWQGHGFAFRYGKSPHLTHKFGPKLLGQENVTQVIKPCPSIIFQNHVKDILLNSHQTSVLFLNSLLNQLNWAFSEFVGMVQEIYNLSSRPEGVFIESRQLKICSTCFDLTIFLLRVLEMICTKAKTVFTDPNFTSNENLLCRLCQLLCQILNRISLQSSAFQHVVLLDIPDLHGVDHFPILAAVTGVLLSLLEEELEIESLQTSSDSVKSQEIPRVTRVIVSEPSFQINSLKFVIGNIKTSNPDVVPFSFKEYKSDVNRGEIRRVEMLIQHLDNFRSELPLSEMTFSDDDLCTICYANFAGVIFKPCSHQSCRACIERHVLNNKNCFFCKSIIKQIVTSDGEIINEFISSNATISASSMDSE